MKKIRIPDEMTAIEIRDQKLVPVKRPVPIPAAGEVLIKVHAAGVNRPDILQRKGLYPPQPGVTDIPGLEVAGDIVALGAGTRKFKKGAKVCALLSGGGYAEYVCVPDVQCLPMLPKMDYIAAASLPETYFTVWTNLFDRGLLKKGESLLVHGGASGIGTAAIQVAKNFGVKVFVTAGNAAKCRACKRLGAHLAVNYRTQDFVTEIQKATKNKGVDVVLDMVGGDYIPRNIRLLAPYGRHVSIAMQKGRTAEMDIAQVMSKRLILTGSTLRPQSIAVKGEIAKAVLKNIWPLFRKKKIRPVIERIFKLEEAQLAHDFLETGNHVGKIILKVS